MSDSQKVAFIFDLPLIEARNDGIPIGTRCLESPHKRCHHSGHSGHSGQCLSLIESKERRWGQR